MQRGAGHLFILHSFSSLCLPQWNPFFPGLSHLYSNRSLDCSQIRFASADKKTRVHHTASCPFCYSTLFLSLYSLCLFTLNPFCYLWNGKKKKKPLSIKVPTFNGCISAAYVKLSPRLEHNFGDLSSYTTREFLISSQNKNSKMSHLET